MTLNPTIAAMLEKGKALPAWSTLTVQAVRATDPARYALGVPPDPVGGIEDRVIPGPEGDLPIRIFRPEGDGPRPVVVFFHGGGFCICSVETHTAICRQICRRSGAIIVSVDYRQAPEHPFPAGPDDCEAATRWVLAHAADLGGDPARVSVCGDSSGGAMAAVVARRLRDAGGPALHAQVLMYPVTDHYSRRHAAWDRVGTGYGLTEATMRWFWDNYLDPGDADNPDASPLRADSVAGLPRTLIVTAAYDLLSDEAEAYADRLRAAGVEVTCQRHNDLVHGFFNWVGLVDRSTEAMDSLGDWMRRNL